MSLRKGLLKPRIAVATLLFAGIATNSCGSGLGLSGGEDLAVVATPTLCETLASSTSYADSGTGTTSDPYLICVAAQLADIADIANVADLGKSFKLMQSIDLSTYYADGGAEFIIGRNTSSAAGWAGTAFSGTFDGSGYTISNFTISTASGLYDDFYFVGLFGYVDATASLISNLSVSCSLTNSLTPENWGCLVGFLNDGTILNSDTSGTNAGHVQAGGFVGQQAGGIIANSSSAVVVSAGANCVGGFSGIMAGGTLKNAYGTGATTGTVSVGGFVGCQSAGSITNAYSTGAVTGTTASVGGFLGLSTGGTVDSSYSTGSVDADAGATNTGQFVGTDAPVGTFTNHYWASTVVVQENSVPVAGNTLGTGTLTEAQLQDGTILPVSNWNLTGNWTINTSAHPTLRSQFCSDYLFATLYTEISGSGTVSDPYQICTADQLANVGADANSADLGKSFKLMADIDLTAYYAASGAEFIIGNDILVDAAFDGTAFTGTFDGNGYSISDFAITTAAGDYDDFYNVGLFGLINSSSAVVSNITVSCNIELSNTPANRGCLAGQLLTGQILNSSASGTVAGASVVGGLVGLVSSPVIGSSSSATVTATGATSSAFVADCASGCFISNSYADGSVSGTTSVGGLAGDFAGTLYNSYSSAAVTGTTQHIGGLYGDDTAGAIYHSYATGSVTASGGATHVGPFGGADTATATISAHYYSSDESSMTNGTNTNGSNAFNTASLQDGTNLPASEWSLTSSWQITSGIHPTLRTQYCSDYLSATTYAEIGGSGTTLDPYEICTADQLADLAAVANTADLDLSYKLMGNIDLTQYYAANGGTASEFIIGSGLTNNTIFDGVAFTGEFDGNDYMISNFTISGAGPYGDFSSVGLFGYLDGASSISDLSVSCDLTASGNPIAWGCLTGLQAVGGAITGSSASGSVNSTRAVGGFIGSSAGIISKSSSSVTVVSSVLTVGGFVGFCAASCAITDSYATGSVTALDLAGGFVGFKDGGAITRTYSTGDVFGAGVRVGGFIGRDESGDIQNSFSTGNSEGTDAANATIGSFVGDQQGGTLTDVWFSSDAGDSDVTNNGAGGTNTTADGSDTTSNLRDGSVTPVNAWDTATIWYLNTGTYPTLR